MTEVWLGLFVECCVGTLFVIFCKDACNTSCHFNCCDCDKPKKNNITSNSINNENQNNENITQIKEYPSQNKNSYIPFEDNIEISQIN